MAKSQINEIKGFRSETAVIKGTRLHYWIGGNPSGTPVLLWHGFLGTAHIWYKVKPLIVELGYSVLVPDMRGFGDSDKPAGTHGYDGLAIAEEIRGLVQHLGFGHGKKLILAALDMGAPPAMLWAGHHPNEIAGVVYTEEPTMLEEFLSQIIVYTPKAMEKGSMGWWVLPLAPGVPERLIVGKEREFLTWFYEGATADPNSTTEESITETLRTFRGKEGALGALGVYRAAFATIQQTSAFKQHKIDVPVLAIGGEKSLGSRVPQMLEAIASNITGELLASCGHFVPEEQPTRFVELLHLFVARVSRQ